MVPKKLVLKNTQTYLKPFHFVDQTQTFSMDQNHDFTNKKVADFPDNCLKFISDILLEEDLDEIPTSEQDLTALIATEKSLHDALCLEQPYTYSSFPAQSVERSNQGCSSNISTSNISSEIHYPSSDNKSTKNKRSLKKDGQGRKSKTQATSNEDYVEMEQFDDVLLSNEQNSPPYSVPVESNRSSWGHKKDGIDMGVDLMSLLNQCAQAVSSFDLKTANELLRQIRQHTSPYGDHTQRVGHYVANALEARLAGTGSILSSNLIDLRMSSSDILRAYRLYVWAIPFRRMFYFIANNTIRELATKATKIHIIDFGVFLGLQWPCIIQALSKRPNGPPNLRITGIEFPQQGFRPSERVEATGRRLSGYCKRFGVPFQYQDIAKNWETIQPEDMKIESDEVVIVNCNFRSRTLLDEAVDVTNSPKDAFLRLVRKLSPDLFIHGIMNGTFDTAFFLNRFKEALYYFSAVFDMLEATIPREVHERLLLESEVWGKEVLNVMACEGAERVQRPETYRQWQARSTRAGLRQVPMNKELVSQAKAMVKANYHKDFIVEQDKHWLLQGWRGRIFCALSFWKPA